MSDKYYRCGYCGHPTDSNGKPLKPNEINDPKGLIDWDSAELTHGTCCLGE